MLATCPVRLTTSPSLTCSHSPNSAVPTLSSSRLKAMPVTPCSNSSISEATAVSRSYCSIRCLRIEVISSGRSFNETPFSVPGKPPGFPDPSTGPLRGQAAAPPVSVSSGSPFQLVSKIVQPAAHTRVETQRAGLQDDAADQVRVDTTRRHDRSARSFLDLRNHIARLVLRERHGGRQLDLEDALLLGDDALEVARDLLYLAGAALLGEQHQEVPDELLLAAEQLLESRGLEAVVELRVSEELTKLRNLALRLDEVAELFAHGVDPVFVLRR